jgi:hypothetical protein
VLKTVLDQLCVYPDFLIKTIMYSGYILEDSRPKELLTSSFANESLRFLICPLLFVSHSRITLMLELDL